VKWFHYWYWLSQVVLDKRPLNRWVAVLVLDYFFPSFVLYCGQRSSLYIYSLLLDLRAETA